MNRDRSDSFFFHALMETLDDAVVIRMPDGSIEGINPAMLALTGWSDGEIRAIGIEGLFGKDLSQYIDMLLNAGRERERLTLDLSCARADGGCFPARVTIYCFACESGTAMLLIIRDRSGDIALADENRRMAKELKHARKMAMLGRLAGGITHYYNNIFTGLMGAIDIAKQEAPSAILPLLKRAENTANTASGFTRRLLSFTRASDDVAEPTDVGALIEDVEQFARLTFDRRITIDVAKPRELDAVLADPAELHHMLLNLMVNARDAVLERADTSLSSEPHVITMEAENVRTAPSEADSPSGFPPRAGRFVRIRISDRGVGMDETTKAHVFEPFFTTKSRGKGTGIGLSAAAVTVRNAGGWITIDSERGKGTSVTVYLPAATMRREVSARRDAEELPRGAETVLIVDDDDMIRALGVMTLERLGYRVIAASDGAEAVDRFLAGRSGIDLVLLDLFLPGLTGRQVLEKIRQIRPGIPVIVTSGHDFERDKEVFAELKADDYVLKPFTITDLAVAVRTVLDRR